MINDPGVNDFFQSNKKIWAMAGFSFLGDENLFQSFTSVS